MTEGAGAAPRPGEAATWGEPVPPATAPAPIRSAPTDKAAGDGVKPSREPRRSPRRADKTAAMTRTAGADTPGPIPTAAPGGRRAQTRARPSGRSATGPNAPVADAPVAGAPAGLDAPAGVDAPAGAGAPAAGMDAPAATDTTGWSPAATDTNGWSSVAATRSRPPLRPEGRPPRRAPGPRDRAQHLRPEAPPPVETIRVRWRDRRRVRLVEQFTGRGVRAKTGWWRRIRSIVLLLVIGAILAGVVAAMLAAAVAGIALGLHHLSKG